MTNAQKQKSIDKSVNKNDALALFLSIPSKPDLKDEFLELIKSANYSVIETLTQSRYPTSSHFFGKGFLERLKEEFEANKYESIKTIIVSSELTPLQYFNIHSFLPPHLDLIDKFQLVLNIFEKRASSLEAKLQIELARLQYNVIFEKNYYLSKMTGGNSEATGGTERRGWGQSGELKIDEIVGDHRKKEAQIKKKLEKIKQDRKVRRKLRTSTDEVVNLSLVGYTNAGKSTFLNSLTHAQVITENKLFTTLSTTTRSFQFYDLPIMITDTVGFLEDLPTRLIDAFRSTLEESLEGDYILLVLDASEAISEIERKMNVTLSILKEIGVNEDEIILILNKINKIEKNEKIWITEWLETTDLAGRPKAFVSALTNNISDFSNLLDGLIPAKRFQISFPDALKSLKSEFFDKCEIIHEKNVFNENFNIFYTVLELKTRREKVFHKLLAKAEKEREKFNLAAISYFEISQN